jgi:hypothetical protein
VGIETVWVNGEIVFEHGRTTGVHSGRPLRREATPPAQGRDVMVRRPNFAR